MKLLTIAILMVIALGFAFTTPLWSQEKNASTALDKRVKAFLNDHASEWHYWNVPAVDGKLLHDIIIKNGYTRALEIGTSTGRSGIWIA
jgi:caffeoyl-CoA O-methyltransferase